MQTKGDVQETECIGLRIHWVIIMRKSQRVCALISALGCGIVMSGTEIGDTGSRAGWARTIISVWDPLN